MKTPGSFLVTSLFRNWAKGQVTTQLRNPTLWWNFLLTLCIAAMAIKIANNLLSAITRYFQQRLSSIQAMRDWKSRKFTRRVQAALYSLEAVMHGRVEKRTVFEVSLDKMLHYNQAMVDKVMQAVEETTAELPFVTAFLPVVDRWMVLNAALNLVSATHAGVHFDHAGAPGSYVHKWYVIAFVCEKKHTEGRRFCETALPESVADRRSVKGRIFVVPEDDLLYINASGMAESKQPECEWQNSRHYQRWLMVQHLAQLYHCQKEEPTNPDWKHLLRLCVPAPAPPNSKENRSSPKHSNAITHKKSWGHPLSAYTFLGGMLSDVQEEDEGEHAGILLGDSATGARSPLW